LVAARPATPSGLARIEHELRDGRYLLAYSRTTSGDDA
jgi:hypothetical protein